MGEMTIIEEYYGVFWALRGDDVFPCSRVIFDAEMRRVGVRYLVSAPTGVSAADACEQLCRMEGPDGAGADSRGGRGRVVPSRGIRRIPDPAVVWDRRRLKDMDPSLHVDSPYRRRRLRDDLRVVEATRQRQGPRVDPRPARHCGAGWVRTGLLPAD